MPATKKMPCEIRLYVSREMHKHVGEAASDRGFHIAAYVRDLIEQDMNRAKRGIVIRKTDPLIHEIAEVTKAIAEKLGVELPEKEPDSEDEKDAKMEVPLLVVDVRRIETDETDEKLSTM